MWRWETPITMLFTMRGSGAGAKEREREGHLVKATLKDNNSKIERRVKEEKNRVDRE